MAPGMGFEPMRPNRATGSQGLRIIHSAIPANLQTNLSSRPSISFYSEHSHESFFIPLLGDGSQTIFSFGTRKTTLFLEPYAPLMQTMLKGEV